MLRVMLRQRGAKTPDERFVQLLHNLIEKYRYRALSTEDLQREAEALMTPAMALEGRNSLGWFFDQWVRGTGIPHYKVTYTARKVESGYSVRGTLHQSGVPKSFLALVPLYVMPEAGKPILLGTVETTGEATHFQFVSSRMPRKVLIDPQLTVLCVND
jgi:aminopeptidase N